MAYLYEYWDGFKWLDRVIRGGNIMSKFGLYGKLIANEGERNSLVEILLEAASSMEELDDCEIYIVSVSDTEPDTVWVYEVWSDRSAHQASLTLESTQTLIKRAKPIIAGMETINMLSPRGGKGITTAS